MKQCAALATVVLFAVGLVGVAQGQPLSIGGHAGGNFATFQGDTDEFTTGLGEVFNTGRSDLGRRTAFRIGVFLEIPLTDVVGLRPEVLYTQKGATLDGSATQVVVGEEFEVEFEGTFRFDYLQIPVLAVVKIPTEGSFTPRLFVGPAVGFNVSAEGEAESTVTGPDTRRTDTITEEADVEDVDLGGVIGGERGYALANGHTIALDLRYNPIFNTVNPDGEFDVRNQVFSAGLSYRITL